MTLTYRLCSSAALSLCLATPVVAETLTVTNFSPEGPGSLQEALDTAGASPARTVIIIDESDGTIATDAGLTYEGTSPVVIIGNGVTITSPNDVTLLSAIGPQVLAIIGARFVGPGGFSIDAQSVGEAGRGIFLDVPISTEGVVSLVLTNVAVSDVAGHGIYVADCAQDTNCVDGSPASVQVELARVRIADVGHGSFDADGLRVDERGLGSIELTGANIEANGVGADGVELDEGQDGDVIVDLIRANFIENGSYCDPGVLQAFLPDPAYAEFEEFEIIPSDLPQLPVDTPDNACFELDLDTYDAGSVEEYEYTIDVDDGFDIDEAGPGSIIGTVSVGQVWANYDQGFDFDETGPGDIDVVFTGIIGNGNLDDAIKLSEADLGDVFLTATAIETSSNGGLGIVAEEDGAGDLTMVLVGSASSGNNGGALGIEAEQDGAGEGNVYVIDSEIADGIETDGVTLDAD